MPQAPSQAPVSDGEVRYLLDYLSSHPDRPACRLTEYGEADAIFVFGRLSPLVAETAARLYRAGRAPRIIITGGLGKDSGKVLTENEVAEAILVGALCEYYGVPREALLLEMKATNGAQNAEFGLRLLTEKLGHRPRRLILVMHAAQLHRLTEQFHTVAGQQGYPSIAVQACPADMEEFNPADLQQRLELVDELERLRTWPGETWPETNLVKLRPQPVLPAHLLAIARQLERERPAA
jgi:hypothetical protein